LTTPHPAPYSPMVRWVMAQQISWGSLTLDPFSGSGLLDGISTHIRAVCVEIEPEWATMVQGNALALPFADETFDAIATSPTFSNRMSDHHNARDDSVRHTYTHTIGHSLHPDNSGRMAWGKAYRDFHHRAWVEALRTLKEGGVFVLNISDHIRKGEVMPVVAWHLATLNALGMVTDRLISIPTRRQRHGANGALRVDHETVAVLRKGI